MIKLAIATAILAISCVTDAVAGSQGGQVVELSVCSSDGLVYFKVSGGTRANSPSCATANYWVIQNENSEAGKKQLALLLAARISGQNITVLGENSCTRWADGEDVKEIIM